MNSLNDFKKKLLFFKETEKLISTIKITSNINYRIFNKYLENLDLYKKNIEYGLWDLFFNKNININQNIKNKNNSKNLYIIFGSTQSFCGKYNEKIYEYIKNYINTDSEIICIGKKISKYFNKNNIVKIVLTLNLKSEIQKVTNEILEIIIEELKNDFSFNLYFCYMIENKILNGNPTLLKILPLNKDLIKNKYNQKKIPFSRINNKTLYIDIFKEYIYYNIQLAILNLITLEEKNRFIIMNNAEDNIKNLIQEINQNYNQLRQNTVTNDLIGITNQFSILKKNKNN